MVNVLSVHKYEAELIKKRSLEFLKEAEIALNRGSYDIACFLTEQSLQLYLKHTLLKTVDDYPRTQNVRGLLGELNQALKSKELEIFIKAHKTELSALEDAYLMARYFIKEYDKDDASNMIRLVKETIKIINKVIGEGG